MSGIAVNRHTFANGLRLVHSRDSYTAMVAVDVLYDVGARDESRSRTGLAHLFEHLMFGGSAHVADFDKVLESAGGKSNAWTSNDFTNFYDTLPAVNLDTALFLESDRMLSPAFSEQSLEVQRGVVIEEFKQQCLDRPYGDLFHHLRALAYAPSHPYSWPVIGLEPEHIASVDMACVKDWFYRHYAPDNAVIAITGNVDFDTACRRVEHWFADVPRRNVRHNRDIDPGFPTADKVEIVEAGAPVPMIAVAYPMASYGEPEYFAADTINDMLSVGRSARLRTRLVNGSAHGLIADADASVIGSEGPGLLLLTARVTSADDTALERARILLVDEARRLAEPGEISPSELERTLNNFEATFRFSNTGYLARASNLAQAELHGEDINATVTDRRRLTVAGLQRTAARIFLDTPSATIIYR